MGPKHVLLIWSRIDLGYRPTKNWLHTPYHQIQFSVLHRIPNFFDMMSTSGRRKDGSLCIENSCLKHRWIQFSLHCRKRLVNRNLQQSIERKKKATGEIQFSLFNGISTTYGLFDIEIGFFSKCLITNVTIFSMIHYNFFFYDYNNLLFRWLFGFK